MNGVDQPAKVLLMVKVQGKTNILKRFTHGNLFYLTYRPIQKAANKIYFDYYSPDHDEKTDRYRMH